MRAHTKEPLRPDFVGFSDSFVTSVPLRNEHSREDSLGNCGASWNRRRSLANLGEQGVTATFAVEDTAPVVRRLKFTPPTEPIPEEG